MSINRGKPQFRLTMRLKLQLDTHDSLAMMKLGKFEFPGQTL